MQGVSIAYKPGLHGWEVSRTRALPDTNDTCDDLNSMTVENDPFDDEEYVFETVVSVGDEYGLSKCDGTTLVSNVTIEICLCNVAEEYVLLPSREKSSEDYYASLLF